MLRRRLRDNAKTCSAIPITASASTRAQSSCPSSAAPAPSRRQRPFPQFKRSGEQHALSRPLRPQPTSGCRHRQYRATGERVRAGGSRPARSIPRRQRSVLADRTPPALPIRPFLRLCRGRMVLTPGDGRTTRMARRRLAPRKGIDQGGIGAIEVNVRYDYLDLIDKGIVGGKQRTAVSRLSGADPICSIIATTGAEFRSGRRHGRGRPRLFRRRFRFAHPDRL